MDDKTWIAGRFEQDREHLRTVAYRMLGSLSEAEDVVQEAWLRLSRSDVRAVENLRGWLTTVVTRISLDVLRSRKARREEPLGPHVPEPVLHAGHPVHPEHEALLAESVGLALLVVLEKLAPAERIAFVLHDLFDLPFDEIAPIVGRSSAATRQLASRARRRVRGTPTMPGGDLARQKKVVEAFLAASRAGDFDALLAVLDPDVLLRAPGKDGGDMVARGAPEVARQAVGRPGTRFARPAMVNGSLGVVVAPRGKLVTAFVLRIDGDRIAEMHVINDRAALDALEIAVVD